MYFYYNQWTSASQRLYPIAEQKSKLNGVIMQSGRLDRDEKLSCCDSVKNLANWMRISEFPSTIFKGIEHWYGHQLNWENGEGGIFLLADTKKCVL